MQSKNTKEQKRTKRASLLRNSFTMRKLHILLPRNEVKIETTVEQNFRENLRRLKLIPPIS